MEKPFNTLCDNEILQNKRLEALEEREKYSSFQEDLAFEKELNILRNDFYYQMIDTSTISLVDFLYKPLDVMSGDAYSARAISDTQNFYLLVDGMGKGLSASLSSMLITSFVNYTIDKMLETKNFNLHALIQEAIYYMEPILLDEETLSIDFIFEDTFLNKLEYAKFAMPPILLQNEKDEIVKIKSNNPPLSKYASKFTISSIDTSDISKFLFYSDGLVENTTNRKGELYLNYIEEDFKNSFTKEDLKNKILKKIKLQEDDITLIFINKLNCTHNDIITKNFKTAFEEIDAASLWYTDTLHSITDNQEAIYYAEVAFTELFMNAFEHGNLEIDSVLKHKLLDEDTYFQTLMEKSETCERTINIILIQVKYKTSTYLLTKISDEGEGFNTQILSEIFRHSKKFNGRGVFVSRKNSLGIYYNAKGNSVLYINKL